MLIKDLAQASNLSKYNCIRILKPGLGTILFVGNILTFKWKKWEIKEKETIFTNFNVTVNKWVTNHVIDFVLKMTG